MAHRGAKGCIDADEQLEALWRGIIEQAEGELGRNCVNQWIRPLRLVALDGDQAELAASTSFLADWVERNYGLQLLRLLQQAFPGLRRLVFRVEPDLGAGRTIPAGSADGSAGRNAEGTGAAEAGDGEDERGARLFSTHLDPRLTFDTFVVGRPNELAYAAARRVAESDDVAFNPVFLHGGVGLGKTHLMQAIAWHVRETRPGCRALYLSAEHFMYRFIRALRFRDMLSFKEELRSVDLLMIDDVQFIAGKDSTQDEFFHTFNALIDQKKQIVISADRTPDRIEGLEERIRSRLQWGLVVDIHPTDYELRLGILQSRAEAFAARDPRFVVEPRVLEFLAHRINDNVRVIEGALTRLYAFASLVGREITLEMTRECLADLLRRADRKITIEEIKRRVAEHYGIRMSDLVSARARRIEQLRETDSQLNDDVERLRRILEG